MFVIDEMTIQFKMTKYRQDWPNRKAALGPTFGCYSITSPADFFFEGIER